MQLQRSWKLLRSVYVSCLFIYHLCHLRCSLIFPFWASAVAVPMWACCHLLTTTCGIWGCKVGMCGMTPRTLYDQPNSKHMLLPLCQLWESCDIYWPLSLTDVFCWMWQTANFLTREDIMVVGSWLTLSRPQDHPPGDRHSQWVLMLFRCFPSAANSNHLKLSFDFWFLF